MPEPSVRTVARSHWVVFAAAFAILLMAAGTRSTPSVLIDPLHEEFGWSRATIGFAVSINVLLFGFIGPYAAALQQRFGLRRVTIFALAVIAAGAVATTQLSRPWHLFVLWGVIVGAGTGCMATVFASTVASRWFVARRGLVTGALTAATASGQLVFLPLLSHLAVSYGWRWVGLVVAVGALAGVPVVLLFLRNYPADVGLRAYGGSVYGCKPSPSLKIATNTPMYTRMAEDMDFNAGAILDGAMTVEEAGRRIFELMLATASGQPSKSEALGFGADEFVPWYLGAVM